MNRRRFEDSSFRCTGIDSLMCWIEFMKSLRSGIDLQVPFQVYPHQSPHGTCTIWIDPGRLEFISKRQEDSGVQKGVKGFAAFGCLEVPMYWGRSVGNSGRILCLGAALGQLGILLGIHIGIPMKIPIQLVLRW